MPTTTIAAIDRQLELRASPERLWRALTEDGELGAWFGQRAQLDLRAGGDGWLEFEGYGRVPVRIEVFEPVTRLSWRWGDAGTSVEEGSTLVEFRLDPLAGGGTRLHLRESGFEREHSRLEQHRGLDDGAGPPREARRGRAVRGGDPPDVHADVDPRPRLWRAFSKPAALGAWWAGTPDLEIRPGYEGWFVWPSEGGRFGMRFEADRAPALPVLELDAGAGGPARDGDHRAAHRMDARPAGGRWDRPPPVRERVHRADWLRRTSTAGAGTTTSCRRSADISARRPDPQPHSFAPGRRVPVRLGRAHPPSTCGMPVRHVDRVERASEHALRSLACPGDTELGRPAPASPCGNA